MALDMNYIIYMILLLTLRYSQSEASIAKISFPNVDSEIIDKCISYILQDETLGSRYFHVIGTSRTTLGNYALLREMQEKYTFSCAVSILPNNGFELLNNVQESDVILIYASSAHAFIVLIEIVNTNSFLNKRARFVVIITSQVSERDIIIISNRCWEAGLLNVIFLRGTLNTLLGNVEQRSCTLTIFNPFLKGKSKFIRSFKINVNYESAAKVHSIIRDVFLDKLRNLHGYTLKASAFSYPPYFMKLINSNGHPSYKGISFKMYHAISNTLNFTLAQTKYYKRINFGEILPNGSWTGTIGDIVRKEVDLSLNLFTALADRMPFIDISSVFLVTDWAIMVKKAKALPLWMAVFLPFELPAWLSILGLLIVLVVFVWALQKFPNTEKFSPKIIGTLTYFLRILLGIGVHLPTQNVTRFLLFLWIYVSFLYISLYTSSLVSVLTVPRYYSDINTLNELLKAVTSIVGAPSLTDIFSHSSNDQIRALSKLIQPATNTTRIMKSVIRDYNTAYLSTDLTLKYEVQYYFRCSGLKLPVHILKENLGCTGFVLPLQKGSPYLLKFNVLIRRAVESGLVNYWIDETFYDAIFQNNCLISEELEAEEAKELSLRMLQTPFFMLVIGYTMSIIVFAGELIYKKVVLVLMKK